MLMNPMPASRPGQCVRARTFGFTLVELVTTLAVLAVLAAIAVPGFSGIIERWRVNKTVDGLKQSLYHARSEAIKHGGDVVMQKLSGSGSMACVDSGDNKDWSCGWFLCHDANRNGKCDAGELPLHDYRTPSKVQVRRTGGGASIKFNQWGLVSGTYLGFGLAPLGAASTHPAARGICVSSAGRVRVAPPAASPCA